MTLDKFFGKLFNQTVLFLILIELISLLSYLAPITQKIIFFAVLIIALIVSLIKLEYGLYLVLAELFVGGHGYLFSIDINGVTVSIRMALFLVVLAVWLGKRIRNYESGIRVSKESIIHNSYFLIPYLLLFLFITTGIINGLLNNSLTNVFFDANAWIYFALIPVFWDILKEQKIVGNIFQILTGATTYLALKTIGVLVLFSHDVTGIGGLFYKWLRDTGVGEVTYMSGSLFRVFFQSQLYVLIGFFIVLTLVLANFNSRDWKKNLIPLTYLYLATLTIIISQSRSYWVGALAALLIILIFTWINLKQPFKKTAGLIGLLTIMIVSQIFVIQLIANNLSGNLVSDRFKNLKTEAAGISRLNQLEPLTYNIFQQLIFGYGFGQELTYVSNDPRVIQTHPGGIYTTYAFEWGYLDIMLKLGGLGLAVYLFLIYRIYRFGLTNVTPLKVGLLAALTAVLITNIFSPYLNHPLGIGYIMLVTAILNS